MGITDILFGKKQVPAFRDQVFTVGTTLHPMRLPAHKADYLNLDIDVRNTFDKPLLTSVVIRLPKELGIEQSALSHEREIRVGQLDGGATKSMRVMIWSTQRTDPGEYKIEIFVLSHYRDYSYVLNEVRKTVEVRAA